MLKKFELPWRLLLPAVLILLVAVRGLSSAWGHHVSIRGQHLQEYCASSGGGMNGGYHRKTLRRYDGNHALLTTERAEWHNQDPVVEEFFLDVSALEELEEVIRKNHMNFWNRKTFTREFVADGESQSYEFRFEEDSIRFSSQIYPAKYRKKLGKLDEIIQNHLENAQPLPGLVNERIGAEEAYDNFEDTLELYVYAYCADRLYIRVLNGTAESLTLSDAWELVRGDNAQMVAQERGEDGTTTYEPYSQDEFSIALPQRLEAGAYKLRLGETEIPFEIR